MMGAAVLVVGVAGAGSALAQVQPPQDRMALVHESVLEGGLAIVHGGNAAAHTTPS